MQRVPLFAHMSHETFESDPNGREKAEALASLIQTQWAEVGHPEVRCRVVPIRNLARYVVAYGIRSNLFNGLPPVQAVQAAA